MTDSSPHNPGRPSTSKASASDSPPTSIIGRVIGGDFEIRREIGRGGMGTVYEAWQHSLKRVVALKVLAGSLGLTGNAVVRFQREAQAAAKLHHNNIVPIYAQGEDDGIYYYAMERIEGRSLNEIIKERSGRPGQRDLDLTKTKIVLGAGSGMKHPSSSDPEQTSSARPTIDQQASPKDSVGEALKSTVEYCDDIADKIAAVADALDYAHKAGVIHRDVKPHNFIFGKDGRMYITDFGLARVLEQPGVTTTGEFVGSPLYMSPEQITGGRVRVDHRTDIYSLGATMYEWLTLSPPYPGETREQVISKIISSEPLAPRSIDPNIPVDLETVCLKAIEKNPGNRYQAATEMAQDLRRYLKRDVIRARRESIVARTRKLIERNRTAVFAGATAVAIAGLAAMVSLIQQTSFDRQRAQQHQEIATIQEDRQQLQNQLHDLEEKQKRLIETIQGGKINAVELGREIIAWFDGAQSDLFERPQEEKRHSTTAQIRNVPPVLDDADRELIAHLASDFLDRLREDPEERTVFPGPELPSALEAESYYRQALAASTPEVALELVNNALRNNLAHFEALYLRAIIYVKLLDFEQVVTEAQAMAMMPLGTQSGAGNVMRGIGLLCTGEARAGIEDFDRALDLDPDNASVLMMRGIAKLFAGDYKSSFADLDRSVELDADNPNPLMARGAIHARRGNFVQAINDLDAAVKMAPNLVPANLERDRIWDRVQEELERFTAVVEENPGDSMALEKRGDLYVLLGDYELAVADYQRANRVSDSPRASLFIKNALATRELNAERATGPGQRPPTEPDLKEQMGTIPDWLRGIIP